jgi:hypothetical protein
MSSVDDISPYWQDTSSLQLNATATGTPSNVTLIYRWSTDNISWDGCNENWINDTVDWNGSTLDGISDKGTEADFANCQDTVPDSDYMILTEANQGGGGCTLGKTSGTTPTVRNLNYDDMYGTVFTASCSGEIYQATFYGRSSSGTRYAKIVICDSSGNILTNGISNMITVTATLGDKTGTWTTGSRPSVVSGNVYWIMVIGDAQYVRMYYQSTTGGNSKYDSTNSFSSPTSPTDATAETYVYYKLYANITNPADYELDME